MRVFGVVAVDPPAKGGFGCQAVPGADLLLPGLVVGHHGLTRGVDAVAPLHPDLESPAIAAKAEVVVVLHHRAGAEVARLQHGNRYGRLREQQLGVGDQANRIAPTTDQPFGPPALRWGRQGRLLR